MKERKQEDISRNMTIRRAFLDRERIAGDARALLSSLEQSLAARERNLKITSDRCSRLSESVRVLVQNANCRCLGSDSTVLARQVLAGRDLDEILREESRDPMLERFVRSINFSSSIPDVITDPGDKLLFCEWLSHRGAIDILRIAVKLQKQIVRDLSKTAMEKFSKSVASSRVATVRRVLELLAELRSATASEMEVSRGLDPDEADQLKPRPWPAQPLAHAAITFLLDAVAAGMIDAAELRDLQPAEIVAPAAATEEAEPYLQGTV